MTDYNKDFNEVMALLKTVPGVTEHLESIQVKLGKEILKRRLELGLTQSIIVDYLRNQHGFPITQPMLSKMESGVKNIESQTYQKVFDALGGIADMNIKFGPIPEELQKKRRPVGQVKRTKELATIS